MTFFCKILLPAGTAILADDVVMATLHVADSAHPAVVTATAVVDSRPVRNTDTVEAFVVQTQVT